MGNCFMVHTKKKVIFKVFVYKHPNEKMGIFFPDKFVTIPLGAIAF
jgi:hypothetical protein